MVSESPARHDDDRLLTRSLGSARSLIGLQLVSRLVTFVLNQGLIRLVSPQAYGTAAVQFELLMSTILFLSREGVRNSLLRIWPQQTNVDQPASAVSVAQCANLAALPFFLGLPTTFVTVVLYAFSASETTTSQPHFHLALLIYATAAVGELLSEPMHNRAMGEVRTDARVKAEGLGIIVKTIITYLILLYDDNRRHLGELALIAFALGQLAYSATVFWTYKPQFPESSLWPISLPEQHQTPRSVIYPSAADAETQSNRKNSWSRLVANFFDPDALHLSMTMTSQSIVKHFLTEGDKFLVSYWSPLQHQGGYAIAVNYGSLVARIVFQPIEEMCRVYFSKALSGPMSQKNSATARTSGNSAALSQASGSLASLLSIQIAFSMLVVTFGSSYLPIVLQLLLPAQYISTSAPKVLSAWIWYIPVLALNGGLEAFYSSVATPQDLRAQSRWMLAFSVIYVLSATALYNIGFGDTSLVYANIANLTARIWYTATFIVIYFGKRMRSHQLTLANVVPGWKFSGIVALSFLAISRNKARHHLAEEVERLGRRALFSTLVLGHVAFGAGLGLVCVGLWWITEGKRLVARERIKAE
ncbi:Rft protein-domain-containing protein [Boletus reticuloceps]|uniref:Man(5)GlcNAc(2)-PP-dolichol translocation protein RFT1 n=1 Tax=Boletus reticuloceps TaxID=495285 RepID=A0A8I3AE53_9AGAM|nr:Rft protein-domain-containing protein [Boletus reticuloceps]